MPYLLWSLIGAIAYLPLFTAFNHINQRPLFEETFLGVGTLLGTLNETFGIMQSPHWSPALWYVRLLLIFFILTPVWLGLRRVSRWLLLVAGVGLIVIGFPMRPIVFLQANGPWGLGWLLLGMTISAFRIENRRIPAWGIGFFFILWIAACVHNAFCPGAPALLRFTPALLFFWSLYDVIARHPTTLSTKIFDLCATWSQFAFFIYCCHFPIAQTMLAMCRFIFKTPIESIPNHMRTIQSLLCFSVALGGSVLVALVLRRWFPKTYAVLAGGR